ncbi:MAG: RagB/SusD family nutrient uptake outer membrane protein [Bacteroidota bacterium]
MMTLRSKTDPLLLIIMAMVLVTLAGCSEDFFTREAGDRITPDQHYTSFRDASISSMGALATLQEAMPRLIMLDGLRSDMMEVTPNADADLREVNNHIFSPGNPYIDPSDFYKVIVNLNEVLANLNRVAENDVEFDEYSAYYHTGMLLGMRAWVYLTMVRQYNQAAYIEDNLTSLPENLEQNILGKEEMIDTLINQLIPYIYDPTQGIEQLEYPVHLFSYINTKAILGELYLERGEYANAVTYLKMACESHLNQLYKVDNTYKDDGWSTIFLNASSAITENFSVIPFNSKEFQNNSLADWLGHSYQYLVKPSEVLINSFMAQIPASGEAGDLYRGLGISFGVDTIWKTSETEFETESYITKYAVDQADPASSDIILSRAADVHLLLAEAYNRMGDEASQELALIFLNQGIKNESPKPSGYATWNKNTGIRGRVYLTPQEVPESLTGEDRIRYIEDLIMAERALELAFEGKRWHDLVRVAERRGEPEFLADKVAAKFEGTGQYDEIHSRMMNPSNWYLPVN